VKVAVIRYNAGNTRSLCLALERLGISPIVTDDPELLRGADRVLFPGVGEAGTAMAQLRKTGLDELIPALKQPFLGICLGLQLLCRRSEEADTEGLGVFDLDVRRFREGKVPHMGWNLVQSGSRCWYDATDGDYAYFVHGYYAAVGPDTVARCDYHTPFSAALRKRNFWAVQFHPEKSAQFGERVLQGFLQS